MTTTKIFFPPLHFPSSSTFKKIPWKRSTLCQNADSSHCLVVIKLWEATQCHKQHYNLAGLAKFPLSFTSSQVFCHHKITRTLPTVRKECNAFCWKRLKILGFVSNLPTSSLIIWVYSTNYIILSLSHSCSNDTTELMSVLALQPRGDIQLTAHTRWDRK